MKPSIISLFSFFQLVQFKMLMYCMCSVIGAIIIGIGYYGLMWGQITEDEVAEDDGAETVDSLEKKIPLLQEEMQV
jgi:hypothetical protein